MDLVLLSAKQPKVSTFYRELEGVQYLVVPTVMMTEGVHNGSSGPIYYSASEMEVFPQTGNHKPVALYHTVKNGKGVSACTPEALESQKIGIVMNTEFKDNAWKCEAWIDVKKANKLDKRIIANIASGTITEVSTGLNCDLEESPGTWNGEKYTKIAKNLRLDHLAILPDQIGACSVKDGAGLLRNSESLLNRIITEYIQPDLLTVVENEMSYSDIAQNAGKALASKYGKPGESWYGYVVEMYQDYLVFRSGENGSLMKQWYSIDNKTNTVTLTGSATPTKRVVTYNTEEKMDLTKHIDLLINSGTYAADEREFLVGLGDKVLKLKPNVAPVVEKPTPVANKETTPTPAVDPKKEQTLEEYLAAAPAKFKDVMLNSLDALNAEIGQLVEKIKASPGCKFTDNQLLSMDVKMLRNMAALIPEPVADTVTTGNNFGRFNYLAASGGRDTTTTNAAKPKVEGLKIPELFPKAG